LWLHARLARKRATQRRPLRQAAILLLANFPLCAFYLAVAAVVSSTGILAITNEQAQPLERITLRDASGEVLSLSAVPPGTHRHCVGPFSEGALHYDIIAGAEQRSGVLSGYVSGLERRFELQIAGDLQVVARTGTEAVSLPEYLRHCLFS
jgi:hypothetical protein